MNLLLWIVLGFLAGWIASVVTKNNTAQGPVMDILLGILGAVVGGFVLNLFGIAGINGFNFYSLIVATLGAVLLIWLRRALIT